MMMTMVVVKKISNLAKELEDIDDEKLKNAFKDGKWEGNIGKKVLAFKDLYIDFAVAKMEKMKEKFKDEEPSEEEVKKTAGKNFMKYNGIIEKLKGIDDHIISEEEAKKIVGLGN